MPMHVGDTGTPLDLLFEDDAGPVNISTATALDLYLVAPDKTVLHRTAALKTTGADGLATYSTLPGDITQAGTYQYEGDATLPGGILWHSDAATFEVAPILPRS